MAAVKVDHHHVPTRPWTPEDSDNVRLYGIDEATGEPLVPLVERTVEADDRETILTSLVTMTEAARCRALNRP